MGDAETKSNKLNRELLRWIQSLDLAYSIKNVKRDFANGFLVAEILSRYYDKDISMHSYDNGIGMKVKKDNWDQLAKLFSKFTDLEPLINKGDTDAIIHCQNGAAVTFLTKLYQCLTKRTIQPTAIAQPPPGAGSIGAPASVAKSLDRVEEIPPYAKPTNSAFIRDKMREPEIAETRDQTQLTRKVRDIHSQHEETQQCK
uniref:Spermatogenesis-associated protein 4 n=1 Tax=Phytophthora ramorum TaxID=164328 RepID=H3H391_PHYRM